MFMLNEKMEAIEISSIWFDIKSLQHTQIRRNFLKINSSNLLLLGLQMIFLFNSTGRYYNKNNLK